MIQKSTFHCPFSYPKNNYFRRSINQVFSTINLITINRFALQLKNNMFLGILYIYDIQYQSSSSSSEKALILESKFNRSKYKSNYLIKALDYIT